jgi:hypothetical protein
MGNHAVGAVIQRTNTTPAPNANRELFAVVDNGSLMCGFPLPPDPLPTFDWRDAISIEKNRALAIAVAGDRILGPKLARWTQTFS